MLRREVEVQPRTAPECRNFWAGFHRNVCPDLGWEREVRRDARRRNLRSACVMLAIATPAAVFWYLLLGAA